ncbi:hypothetical protein PoB_000557200 [Plakobranchus ocellatus]|uniref:Uncharacterized protein n=1 Tax=Plakobranchus ocellatus TaxID=259542 RepID=A0AAV3Y8F8_9GAST|nr:hypothetical protein PoB_000557200 [Plakobranchus ocellatus]
MISGFEALRQARAPVAGLEPPADLRAESLTTVRLTSIRGESRFSMYQKIDSKSGPLDKGSGAGALQVHYASAELLAHEHRV